MTPDYPQFFALANLRAAWLRVEDAAGCAGIDGVTLEWYADHLEEELAQLQRELREKTYQPLPLVRFFVNKPNGGRRPLAVLSVRDRVAQHALLNLIAPLLEAEFEACSFAYRKGRSVQQALLQIEQLRDDGYQYVVDADITSYFDNVDHALLLQRLSTLIPDNDLLTVIRLWLTPRLYDGVQFTRADKGLPQGAPLSPLFANLYLDTFDEQMMSAGYKLIRFADDFLVLCKTKPKAEEALRLTKKVLGELRLAIHEEKTAVTNFATGFKFLGAMFIHSLCLTAQKRTLEDPQAPVTMPPPLPILRIRPGTKNPFNPLPDTELATLHDQITAAATLAPDAQPDLPPPTLFTLRTLYLHEHGAILRCEDDHLRVLKDDTELLSLPAFKIDQIFLFGNAQVTTPAMKFCLENKIPIILLSGRGEFFGALESTSNTNVLLQQKQFARADDDAFVLNTARAIVAGKIANCRALLQRRQRAEADPRLAKAIFGLNDARDRLNDAATLDEVRGYEGTASAQYFAGLAACFSPPFVWKNRSRRPPLDPINALLSFGYTLLFYNIFSIVRGRGLSPYVGSLHSLQQGHPALCSDLIEEFRAPIVDALVTTVLNKRILAPTDFHTSEFGSGKQGCFLTDTARRKFVAQFEERINTIVLHPRANIRTTWRGCLDLQISHWIQVLRGEAESYLPIEIR